MSGVKLYSEINSVFWSKDNQKVYTGKAKERREREQTDLVAANTKPLNLAFSSVSVLNTCSSRIKWPPKPKKMSQNTVAGADQETLTGFRVVRFMGFFSALDLIDHGRSLAPMECEVAEDASLELLHKLLAQRLCIFFASEELVYVLFTPFAPLQVLDR